MADITLTVEEALKKVSDIEVQPLAERDKDGNPIGANVVLKFDAYSDAVKDVVEPVDFLRTFIMNNLAHNNPRNAKP